MFNDKKIKELESSLHTQRSEIESRKTEIEAQNTRLDDIDLVNEAQTQWNAATGQAIDDILKQLIEAKAEIAILQQHLAPYIEREKKKQSNVPHIEIISEEWKPDGLQLKLDWNDPLINYLKKMGYAGVDDEEIVEAYMSDLFQSKMHDIRK